MKTIPESPRYNVISNKALFFLLQYRLSTLPIFPSEIIKQLNCSIRTYSFHAKKLGYSVRDVCEACGSKDGYSIYDESTGKYKIMYNDQIPWPNRIRFTLMHEIAHIYLHHFIDFKQTRLCRGGLNDDELDVLDKEANHFASKVLAPEIILLHAGWKHHKIIRKRCALSTEASKYKADKIIEMEKTRDFITNLEVKVLRQFHGFIHQKTCSNCNHYFIIPSAKHCPICGSQSINWGEGKDKMIYDGFELDHNSKAKICPRCENEIVDPEGEFCQICGIRLINECWGKYEYDERNDESYFKEGCQLPVEGDARFCTKCGSQTTFYRDNILCPWEKEYNQKKGIKEADLIPEHEIPF